MVMDSRAADNLIRPHARRIRWLADRYTRAAGLSDDVSDDLWVAGALALIEAAGRFAVVRDTSLMTYAEPRIRGAMVDELRRLDPVPRRMRQALKRLQRTVEQLRQTRGRDPTLGELAEETARPVEELGWLLAVDQPAAPLDPQFPGLDRAADEALAQAALLQALWAAVRVLPERQRRIVDLYYMVGRTYREIAGILGVSVPRICQLHAEILERLRTLLVTRGWTFRDLT